MVRIDGLKGPLRDVAEQIVQCALRLDHKQRVQIGTRYLADDDPKYLVNCAIVWEALDATGRGLPLGWFEAVFDSDGWVGNKALDAIADAVMATLVKDVIPQDVWEALVSPWEQGVSGI